MREQDQVVRKLGQILHLRAGEPGTSRGIWQVRISTCDLCTSPRAKLLGGRIDTSRLMKESSVASRRMGAVLWRNSCGWVRAGLASQPHSNIVRVKSNAIGDFEGRDLALGSHLVDLFHGNIQDARDIFHTQSFLLLFDNIG